MSICFNYLHKGFLLVLALIVGTINGLQAQNGKKELYLPKEIWKVPKGNNFNDTASKYNMQYRQESDNLAIFWPKSFGLHPENSTDPNIHFSPDSILAASEKFYQYYVDSLQFVQPGNSISDKYKVLFIVCDDKDGTAYGGGSEENPKIGILWTPPSRIFYAPYGAIAHELGHVFQTFVSADGGNGFSNAGQSMYEMTSQYMLWQMYPEWMTFENYHVQAFQNQSYLAFLHPGNMYHSPFILEYWSEKYGKDYIGKLWKFAQKGEDPVTTFKRLNHLTQEQFNDEIFDASRHLVNWDLSRIADLAKPYRDHFKVKLDTLQNGYFAISRENIPQDYGFNVIPIDLRRKDKFDLNISQSIDSVPISIRYGIVYQTNNDCFIYSQIYNNLNKKHSIKISKNVKKVWLVVMGAPKVHKPIILGDKTIKYRTYPYKFIIK